uniref:Uncharacterized protein n=2 Tax=Oryza TaxID=4527 RepID=A0A0D3FY23_9ORYZ
MAAVPVQGGGRRARAPAPFARRGVRNLVVLSILSEVGAVVYAIIMTKSVDLDWQMRAIRKDQKLLERLREERKAKIDELKERTNYYLTQKLIQHTKAKGSSTGNAADDHNTGQVSEAVGDHLEAMEPSRVVGHYQSSGLARKEDFPHVTYCCPHCHALNMSNQTIGRWSGSNSGQLTSSAQVSGTNPVADNELGNQTEGQEIYVEENSGEGQGIYVEENSGKQPVNVD